MSTLHSESSKFHSALDSEARPAARPAPGSVPEPVLVGPRRTLSAAADSRIVTHPGGPGTRRVTVRPVTGSRLTRPGPT
eukprot:754043-Hanusia_phi.AAC.3